MSEKLYFRILTDSKAIGHTCHPDGRTDLHWATTNKELLRIPTTVKESSVGPHMRNEGPIIPNCPLQVCCGEAGLPENHGRWPLCQGSRHCAATGAGSHSAQPLPLCFALSPPSLCCKMPCSSGQNLETSNRCFCPKYQGAQAPAASPNEKWKALIEDPIILYNERGGKLISAEWDRAISGDFKTVSSEKEMVSPLRHHEKKVIQHWPGFLIHRAFYLYFFFYILFPSISHLAVCLGVEWPDLQEFWIIIKSTFCCESKQSPIKFYHANSLIWNSCGLCRW